MPPSTACGPHRSLGPYRLFGYLSIPTGDGPFPGSLLCAEVPECAGNHPPGHGEPGQRVPVHDFRALAGRGQRKRPIHALRRDCFPACSPTALTRLRRTSFRGIVGRIASGVCNFCRHGVNWTPRRVVVVVATIWPCLHRRPAAGSHARRDRTGAVLQHEPRRPPRRVPTLWKRSTTTYAPFPDRVLRLCTPHAGSLRPAGRSRRAWSGHTLLYGSRSPRHLAGRAGPWGHW